MGVDLIVSVYSTDLSDGAGEGNRQGRSMFIMMGNCVSRHYPSSIKAIVYTEHTEQSL